jgi:type IV secretory pathway VirB10-like protein
VPAPSLLEAVSKIARHSVQAPIAAVHAADTSTEVATAVTQTTEPNPDKRATTALQTNVEASTTTAITKAHPTKPHASALVPPATPAQDMPIPIAPEKAGIVGTHEAPSPAPIAIRSLANSV